MSRLFSVIVLLIIYTASVAGEWPKNNSRVNYRLVGFSVPVNENAAYYIFEIAAGINNNDVYFKKNIIITDTSAGNCITALVPSFGQPYTWRVSYINKKNKVKDKTPLYHFTTDTLLYADTGRYRLHVITPDTTHKNLFIMVDATRTMYDAATALPIWFLPNIPGFVNDQTAVRDLKPTPHGTFTLLAGDKPCEVDYDGNVLWQAPGNGIISGDSSEFYHHEFTRLQNGHYMAAGTEHILWPEEAGGIDSLQQKRRRGNDNRVLCGTLIEYDSTGKITWFWKSSSYFSYKDLFSRRPGTNVTAKTHLNGFYFDEHNNYIYVSFRDVSRVVKIYYPEKRVIASYGENYVPGEYRPGNGFFYGQHNCRISSKGELYLFNNNAIMQKGEDKRENNKTKLLVMREPGHENDSLAITWQYSCEIDTFASGKSLGGGSMCELYDGSFLSSMGTINRIFIVSPQKQLLWNVLVEMNAGATWQPYPSYRASTINNRQELEKIIFKYRK